MPNLPNGSPQEMIGTSSTVSPAGAILPFFRPRNYYPNPLRAQGPGGIQSGASAMPAYPPQTGRPGGNNGGFGGTGGSMTSGNGSMRSIGSPSTNGKSNAVAGNPFSFTDSPVPVLLIMLLVSILLLRFVHYGY
jgi:hypothetical protein